MRIFLSAFVMTFFFGFLAYPQPQDSIFVIISGDTVHIWNTGAYENCGCLFRMDVSISNDTIYVTEVDTASDWAYCLCNFDLCVSVTGLQSGNYFVEVFRKMPLVNPDTLFYIGSTSFTYGGSPLAFESGSYQSDCYNITQVQEDAVQPKEFNLDQNYPNPFNPITTIKYQISELSFVTLKVYDVLGSELETLVNEELPAGKYNVEFRTANLELSSGIYFYQLSATGGAGNFVKTKKMLMLK